MDNFEPKIIAFLCNWCSYRGADLVGTSRFHYPPNVRPIRVMCSGSIDPVYILKALLNGADSVLIGGCHLGDCHYQNGNYRAKRRIDMLKAILRQVGIDEDRIWLRWISASKGGAGDLYATLVDQFKVHRGDFSRSAICSIASGRKAAEAIDKYLGGDGVIDEPLLPPEEPIQFKSWAV